MWGSIAAGASDGTINVWHIASGALLHTLKGHTKTVHVVTFSSDGQLIASGSDHKTVCVWKPGALLQRLQHSSGILGRGCSIMCLSFAPNGQTLASATKDGTVRIWNVGPRSTPAETKTTRPSSRTHPDDAEPLRVIKDALGKDGLRRLVYELEYSDSGTHVVTFQGRYRVDASTSSADERRRHPPKLDMQGRYGWITCDELRILRLPQGFTYERQFRTEDLLVYSHVDGTISISRVDEAKLRRQIADRKAELDKNASG
jgi:hypothetical protein